MNDKIKQKLMQLIQENPELPVVPATYYEVCAEDWGYWVGEISEIKVDYYFDDFGSEMWYAGEENIKDRLYDIFEEKGSFRNSSQDEIDIFIENKFNEIFNDGKIFKAIIMYISV